MAMREVVVVAMIAMEQSEAGAGASQQADKRGRSSRGPALHVTDGFQGWRWRLPRRHPLRPAASHARPNTQGRAAADRDAPPSRRRPRPPASTRPAASRPPPARHADLARRPRRRLLHRLGASAHAVLQCALAAPSMRAAVGRGAPSRLHSRRGVSLAGACRRRPLLSERCAEEPLRRVRCWPCCIVTPS